MNKNRKALYGLMENYFYYCEHEGYCSFDTWCEGNIDNEEQEKIMFAMKYHVETIADILFDY